MAALTAVALVAAACGDDSTDTAATSSQPAQVDTSVTGPANAPSTTIDPTVYPPGDFDELKAIFDPMLAPLDVRLTRGALIDRTGGRYQPKTTGTHLALYVEPIDDSAYPLSRYVNAMFDVSAVVSPYVYDSWSAIETYDICQEPHQIDDDADSPFPVTQIEMTREQNDAIDWAGGDLAGMLTVLLNGTDAGARVLVSNDIRAEDNYQAAEDIAYNR